MSALREFATQQSNAVTKYGRPIVLHEDETEFTLKSVRVALSQIQAPVKTSLINDTLVLMPAPGKRSETKEELVQPKKRYTIDNRISSKSHDLSIIAAVHLLIEKGVLESFTVEGLSEEDFRSTYKEQLEWFEIVEGPKGVILL